MDECGFKFVFVGRYEFGLTQGTVVVALEEDVSRMLETNSMVAKTKKRLKS